MILSRITKKESKTAVIKVFGGLDRRDKISDSSLSEMTNMSAEAIPALSPRRARSHIADVSGATAIVAPEYTGGALTSFTGVRGNKFYYNGTAVGGTLTNGEKSIADFNGKICIFPDKVYYDYVPSPDDGSVAASLVSMEKAIDVTGPVFYSSKNDTTGEYTAYISKSGAEFDSNFEVGDSIVISGCKTTQNNTRSIESRRDYAADDEIVSAVADSVSANRIDLILYNKRGERVCFKSATESGSITLKKAVPDMNFICVHNNRLWGTAASGEYIYASKLGDCTNFNSFQGLSDDSWYSYVATGGDFTGICSYRMAVVAFKRNCIHHVYGDAPVNFSIPKQTFGGCIDGRSICEIQGVLYYLAQDGFYAYTGGEPYAVAPQLKLKYSSCAGGTDGRHYYAAAKCDNDSCDVLVYTPSLNVWVREDDTPFEDFCSYNGSVYGIADGEMWRLDCGGEEQFSWSVVSKRFTYDMIEHKGLSCLRIRAELEPNVYADVSVSLDGKEFTNFGRISNNENQKKFSVWRIPIRFGKCNSFRIQLNGVGAAVIHDIEITSHNGGKIYG